MKKILRPKNLINIKNKRLINYSSNLKYPLNSKIKTLDHILFYEELCSQSKNVFFEENEKKKIDLENLKIDEIEKEFFEFENKLSNKYALAKFRNKKKGFFINKRKLSLIKNLNKNKKK